MSLTMDVEPSPLVKNETGTVNVGNTRVTLDTVIGAYLDGESAETIADQYPVLKLADIYFTIAYFLRHQDEVNQYLQERRALAARLRAQIEAEMNPIGFRQRLLARQRGAE